VRHSSGGTPRPLQKPRPTPGFEFCLAGARRDPIAKGAGKPEWAFKGPLTGFSFRRIRQGVVGKGDLITPSASHQKEQKSGSACAGRSAF
jgi:hypothetical protein